MRQNQEQPQSQPAIATLKARKLVADLDRLTEQSENFHINEMQRQLDREAEEAERWDGLS